MKTLQLSYASMTIGSASYLASLGYSLACKASTKVVVMVKGDVK